jgi:uncharacterized RDD family membrane protein YckC
MAVEATMTEVVRVDVSDEVAQGPQAAQAGIVSRSLAFGIDATIVVLATSIGALAVQAIVRVLVRGEARFDLGTLWLLTLPGIFGVYCVTFWVLAGRTLGKAALGLRVVPMDGGPLRFRTAVLRALGYVVSAFFMIGFAWIAVDRREQGFHDKIARTYVIYDR